MNFLLFKTLFFMIMKLNKSFWQQERGRGRNQKKKSQKSVTYYLKGILQQNANRKMKLPDLCLCWGSTGSPIFLDHSDFRFRYFRRPWNSPTRPSRVWPPSPPSRSPNWCRMEPLKKIIWLNYPVELLMLKISNATSKIVVNVDKIEQGY